MENIGRPRQLPKTAYRWARPKVLETTALGAAYLAGLTVNLWKARDEIAAHWKLERRFEPRIERSDAGARMARSRDAVSRSRNRANA